MLFLYEEKLIQGSPQCWIDLGSPEAWRWYMCLVSVCLFVGPALIISACYAIIVKTIWANGSIFLPTGNITFSKCLITIELYYYYRNHNIILAERGATPARRASSRGIIPRAKVKTVKMTLTIVFVFIICWSPYIIFDLLQVFDTAQRADRHRLALHGGLEGGQPGLQGHPLLAGRRHILVHLRPGGHEHRQIRRHQAPHELLKVV